MSNNCILKYRQNSVQVGRIISFHTIKKFHTFAGLLDASSSAKARAPEVSA